MQTLYDGRTTIYGLSVTACFVGVVARVESLPLAAKRLGNFVRGRMGESDVSPSGGRQGRGERSRSVNGLSPEGDTPRFESLLAEAFSN